MPSEIGPRETYGELHDRFARLGAQMLAKAVPLAAAGLLQRRPQTGLARAEAVAATLTRPLSKARPRRGLGLDRAAHRQSRPFALARSGGPCRIRPQSGQTRRRRSGAVTPGRTASLRERRAVCGTALLVAAATGRSPSSGSCRRIAPQCQARNSPRAVGSLSAPAAPRRPSARELALAVVRDVFGPEARAEPQAAFDVRAAPPGLDARDRAFAAELAFGAIRCAGSSTGISSRSSTSASARCRRRFGDPPAGRQSVVLHGRRRSSRRRLRNGQPRAAPRSQGNRRARQRGVAALHRRRAAGSRSERFRARDGLSRYDLFAAELDCRSWSQQFNGTRDAVLAGVNAPPHFAVRQHAARRSRRGHAPASKARRNRASFAVRLRRA